MKTTTIDNIKVGMFAMAGVLFLILLLYTTSKNRNLLGSTFTVQAMVTNANGLVPGNNVRFKGIDVGTVKTIAIKNQTDIYITMVIDEKMKPFILKNATVSISTDGLMGNKLININPQISPSDPVSEGDVLQSRAAIETDEMLRTLSTTNNNIEQISQNLLEITTKLNSSQSLWMLLSDTTITRNLLETARYVRDAGENTAAMTQSAKDLVSRIEEGNGIGYKIFTDTTYIRNLSEALRNIQQTSEQVAASTNDLRAVVESVKRGEGAAGLVLSDTAFRQALHRSIENIEMGTENFNQNMEALKSNFLFRTYFKNLEKTSKK